jgi:hypothetical protein
MEFPVVNTRGDLDALTGTQQHAEFIANMKGSMITLRNVAIYPDDYGRTRQAGDVGYIAPDWQDVEDLSAIERFGFSKSEILAISPGE